MSKTYYQLVSTVNGARLFHPAPFTSMTAAGLFAIIHDYRNWKCEPVKVGEDTPELPLQFTLA